MRVHFGKRIARYSNLAASVLILALLLGGCSAQETVGDFKLNDLVSPFERTSNINRYDNYDENGNVSGYWIDEYALEGKLLSKKLYSEDDRLLREERFSHPDNYTTRAEVYDGNGILTEIREEIFDPEINPNPNLPQELRVYNAENELIQFEQYEYVDINNFVWCIVSYGEKNYEDGVKNIWRERFDEDRECSMITWQALYENDVMTTEYFYDEDGRTTTIRHYNDDGTFFDETP